MMKRISISAFLKILVCALCIVLTVATTIFYTIVYRNSLYETAVINAEQAVSQATETIEIYAENMQNDLKMIEKEIEWCNSVDELNDYLDHMVQISSSCVSIVVYDRDGTILNYGADNKRLKKEIQVDLSFLPDLFLTANYEISAPHVQSIFEGSYPWVATVGNQNYVSIYGRDVYIAMDVQVLSILSYLDQVGIGQRGYCFVVDKYGNMVYHPQQQLIYSGLKQEQATILPDQKESIKAGDMIYSAKQLSDGHWTVIGVSYIDEFVTEKLKALWWLVIINVLLCMLLAYAIVKIFQHNISGPVRHLVRAMAEFEQNTESYHYETEKGVYEMQILSESFEHMVKRLQRLMEQVKNEEILLRKTELKALQTQINPHFLYNTLDSIQWMCERNEKERAVKMVGALAKLFRISISKGKEVIRVEEEIEHARNYMVIQTFRYRNQFSYRFDVDERALPYLCNKITLQPIIENAIIHGIDPMYEDGEIIITVREKEDKIIFTVTDNGMGMSRQQCESLLKDETNDNFGIGIKNVNDRIRIYFGEEYGLSIESEMDVGTRITITFPKVTLDDVSENQ